MSDSYPFINENNQFVHNGADHALSALTKGEVYGNQYYIGAVDAPPNTLGSQAYFVANPASVQIATASGYAGQTYYEYLDIIANDALYIQTAQAIQIQYGTDGPVVGSWSDPFGKTRMLKGLSQSTIRLTAKTFANVVVFGAVKISVSLPAVVPAPFQFNPTPPYATYAVSPGLTGQYTLKPLLPPTPVDLSVIATLYALPVFDSSNFPSPGTYIASFNWTVLDTANELAAVQLSRHYFCGRNRSYDELGRFDAQVLAGTTSVVLVGNSLSYPAQIVAGVGAGRYAYDIIVAHGASPGDQFTVDAVTYTLDASGRYVVASSANGGSYPTQPVFGLITPIGTDMTFTCYRVWLNYVGHAYNNGYAFHSSMSQIDGVAWIDWYAGNLANIRMADVTTYRF